MVAESFDSPDTYHHDSIKLRMGRPLDNPHVCWIEIQNRGSKAISLPTRLNRDWVFATKVDQLWPLRLQDGTPDSLQIGKPHNKETDNLRISSVDVERSKTVMLEPGEVLIFTFDLRRILKAESWSWSGQPMPPKSPIVNGNGTVSMQPIALWAEFPLGKERTPLRTRPLMVYPQRLFEYADQGAGKAQDAGNASLGEELDFAAKQPTEKAAQRAEGLKKAALLYVALQYFGPEPEKKTGLFLHSDSADYKLRFRAQTAHISPEQCRRIIDYLALEGFLDKARVYDSADPRPEGPTYQLRVSSGKESCAEDLGWNPDMLRHLDGLRKVLDGEAGKAMDRVLEEVRKDLSPKQQAQSASEKTSKASDATKPHQASIAGSVESLPAKKPVANARVVIQGTTTNEKSWSLHAYEAARKELLAYAQHPSNAETLVEFLLEHMRHRQLREDDSGGKAMRLIVEIGKPAVTEGYSLPRESQERNRLGPFQVKIKHATDTAERAMEACLIARQNPPDIGHSTVLFRKSVPLDRPGRYHIQVCSTGGSSNGTARIACGKSWTKSSPARHMTRRISSRPFRRA